MFFFCIFFNRINKIRKNVLPKRLKDIQKKEIIKRFLNGEPPNLLADKFGYTKLTILKHIKESIGNELFNNLNKSIKPTNNDKISGDSTKNNKFVKEIKQDKMDFQEESIDQNFNENNSLENSSFMELVPLDLDIDNTKRKDLSSVPISQIDFPEMVYIIVDKKIELEIKLLKDYPEWHFLPEEDLQIKTIEIYFDLKLAKRDCKKDQKVIKIPNPNVFIIASKIMVSRGITRIICDKQLISL